MAPRAGWRWWLVTASGIRVILTRSVGSIGQNARVSRESYGRRLTTVDAAEVWRRRDEQACGAATAEGMFTPQLVAR